MAFAFRISNAAGIKAIGTNNLVISIMHTHTWMEWLVIEQAVKFHMLIAFIRSNPKKKKLNNFSYSSRKMNRKSILHRAAHQSICENSNATIAGMIRRVTQSDV